jgi:hypothetical protein
MENARWKPWLAPDKFDTALRLPVLKRFNCLFTDQNDQLMQQKSITCLMNIPHLYNA